MDWTIHSIGDAGFLAEILNAVAMIVGTGEFGAVAQIGLFLGVLYIFIQSVFAGAQKIEWQKALAAWIVFQVVFGSGETVIIEDAYTGQTHVVDNVPLGVAASGSLISEIGYQITSSFETGFSSPAMTTQGFGSGMETVKAIRYNSLNMSSLGAANNIGGGNFWQSWTNYVRECTSTKVTLDASGKTLNSIVNNPSVLAALEFSDVNFTTMIQVSPTPETLSCAGAYIKLNTYTLTTFLPAFKTIILSRVLGVAANEAAVTIKVQDALDGLGLAIDQNDLILSSVLEPIFNEGMSFRAEDDMDFNYASAIRDAMKQREMSWMAEASLFQSIVHPMLTFLEGFVYAVTPLMGFLIVLGPMGLAVAGKYILMLIWIQLWMPVLAITNFYAHFILAGKLATLSATGMDLTSIVGLYQSGNEIQRWLSTAQMLASSTPALTLMLIYGSSVTATHLAGRLQGGDHVDEKRIAPDRVNASPMIMKTAQLSHDPTRGVGATGAAGMLQSFSFNSSRSDAETSAWESSQSSSKRFSESLSQAVTNSLSQGQRGGQMSMFKAGTGAEQSEVHQMVMQRVQGLAEKHNITDKEDLQLMANAVASAALGANYSLKRFGKAPKGSGPAATPTDVGGTGAKAELGGSGSLTGLWNNSTAAAVESDIRNSIGSDQAFQSAFKTSAMKEISNNYETSFAKGVSVETGSKLDQQADEAIAYQEKYAQQSSLSRGSGTAQVMDGAQAATRVAESGAMSTLYAAIERRPGMLGAVNSFMVQRPDIAKAFGGDTNKAWAYAALVTLDGQNPNASTRDSQERSERHDDLDKVLSQARGLEQSAPNGSSVAGMSASNRGVQERTANELEPTGAVQSRVTNSTGNISVPSAPQVQSNVEQGLAANAQASKPSNQEIKERSDNYKLENEAEHARLAAPLAAHVQAHRDAVTNEVTPVEPSSLWGGTPSSPALQPTSPNLSAPVNAPTAKPSMRAQGTSTVPDTDPQPDQEPAGSSGSHPGPLSQRSAPN
ncbi:conjugal transfer protein TraG N-terminal domain-containing protein [Azospirillum sp. SYSU D00513]|uniref:conjugal transfer protein TraG N-terminal domain-containing protein n=1 Tax=Azospirillum sp. SYSU D00513 TaxID=2812561 RepID=UPI001A96F752|nr:conjugal transfer protein TraG N-terminal domain-containing protein [Azospirillum sp. SYSU D00513]